MLDDARSFDKLRINREAKMQLIQDKKLEEDAGPYYGKYPGTFHNARRQVRADLFDDGSEVVAYISFAKGVDGANVQDRYRGLLTEYAVSKGFHDRFRIVYAA
jgi:hypothetical protein